jgi:hypothetical protein
MDIIVWAIDLVWDVTTAFLSTIMNLKLFEYGEGDMYLAIRVYHFVFTAMGFDIVFLILYAYFRRGGE